MTIEQHRQLHACLRFILLFGSFGLLYAAQPPGAWGVISFVALGVMVFVGATVIAMRIPARCAISTCHGHARLRTIDGHHWYVCDACGAQEDGGSQQMGPDP